jgi:hypothetical protein
MQFFANPTCVDFLKTILNKASTRGNPVLEGGDIAKIFSDFLARKRAVSYEDPYLEHITRRRQDEFSLVERETE